MNGQLCCHCCCCPSFCAARGTHVADICFCVCAHKATGVFSWCFLFYLFAEYYIKSLQHLDCTRRLQPGSSFRLPFINLQPGDFTNRPAAPTPMRPPIFLASIAALNSDCKPMPVESRSTVANSTCHKTCESNEFFMRCWLLFANQHRFMLHLNFPLTHTYINKCVISMDPCDVRNATLIKLVLNDSIQVEF